MQSYWVKDTKNVSPSGLATETIKFKEKLKIKFPYDSKTKCCVVFWLESLNSFQKINSSRHTLCLGLNGTGSFNPCLPDSSLSKAFLLSRIN